MSLKGKGLWKTPNGFIMKWGDDSLWYTTPGTSTFTQIWEHKNYEGWTGEEELEGAALVAPLSILFWEDE